MPSGILRQVAGRGTSTQSPHINKVHQRLHLQRHAVRAGRIQYAWQRKFIMAKIQMSPLESKSQKGGLGALTTSLLNVPDLSHMVFSTKWTNLLGHIIKNYEESCNIWMPFPDTLQSTGRLLEVVVMTKAPVTHNLVTQREPHPVMRGIQQLTMIRPKILDCSLVGFHSIHNRFRRGYSPAFSHGFYSCKN